MGVEFNKEFTFIKAKFLYKRRARQIILYGLCAEKDLTYFIKI
jgi:hypothetical protein